MIAHLASVLVVLVAGVVGAVTVRPPTDDVLRTVSAASASATAAGTFRSTFTFDVEGSGLNVSSRGEMFVDTVRKVQTGSFSAPGIGRLEFVQIGDTAYLKVPKGRAAPGGQHWYGLTSPGGAAAVGSQDPLAFLRALSGSDEVSSAGSETVNGVETTRYEVDLDVQALADASAKNGGTALPPGAVDAIEDATAEVWIDDAGLPRRMRMAMSAQNLDFRFAFEFLDYGGVVTATAPPASDVLMVSSPSQLTGLFGATAAG